MGTTLSQLIEKDEGLQETVADADVVIDFSSPEGTEKAIEMGKPLVCGTTALPQKTLSRLEELSKSVPVLYSPNFSLGIALLFQTLEEMGEKLKKYSTPTIHETHHIHKKDTPSGTALKMAEILGIPPIEIESSREGEAVGIHQVDFLFPDEKLSLTHKAESREAFARGALTAAKFLFGKPAKFYSLRDLFD